MTELVLYEFTDLTPNLIMNVGMIIEENIKTPFIWDNKENQYDVLLCIDKNNKKIISVGIVIKKDLNELKYLCVIESYRNKGIGTKIVNKFLNKYDILYLEISSNNKAYNFYFSKFNLYYNKDKEKYIITSKI